MMALITNNDENNHNNSNNDRKIKLIFIEENYSIFYLFKISGKENTTIKCICTYARMNA